MDANIKTPQDALKWIERRIREEVDCDGEMTNDHAIELAFIGAMLDKFPTRNCDKFCTIEEAEAAFLKERGASHRRVLSDEYFDFLDWLVKRGGIV